MPSGMWLFQNSIGLPTTSVSMARLTAWAASERPNGPAPTISSSASSFMSFLSLASLTHTSDKPIVPICRSL